MPNKDDASTPATGYAFLLNLLLFSVLAVWIFVPPGNWTWVLVGAGVVVALLVGFVVYFHYRNRRLRALQRYLATGEFAEGELAVRRQLEANPDSAELHNHHGIMLLKLERFDEAAAAFERAEPDENHRWIARLNRGFALCKGGRWNEGEPLILEAETEPTMRVAARYHLAQLHAERGQFDEALEWFDHAEAAYEELDPVKRPGYEQIRTKTRALLDGDGITDASGRL